MSQQTRLGMYGGPRAPYGSFAGKTAFTSITGGCWAAGQVHRPRFQEGQEYLAGFQGEVYNGGFQAGQEVCE